MTEPEGQTARDIFPEDEGIPDLQDGSPEQAWAEDPEYRPLPGERAGASIDYGTTALEQSEDESLDRRLAREEPDLEPGIRAAEDPGRASLQLEQDADTSPGDDSGTDSTDDDIEATADAPVGGESAEEAAVHVTDL